MTLLTGTLRDERQMPCAAEEQTRLVDGLTRRFAQPGKSILANADDSEPGGCRGKKCVGHAARFKCRMPNRLVVPVSY